MDKTLASTNSGTNFGDSKTRNHSSDITDKFRSAEGGIKNMIANAVCNLDKFIDGKKEAAKVATDKCATKIKDNPFKAAASLLAVGVLLGSVLKLKKVK